jgi:hypothetical protein
MMKKARRYAIITMLTIKPTMTLVVKVNMVRKITIAPIGTMAWLAESV